MQYAPSDLKPRERYKVLTSFVLPRPIAWVTTIGPTGVVNAAPFSFFNVFCEDPPLCMFAANLRPDGRVKDTVINIRATNEFVVNMTDEPLAQAMHESSGDFPPDIGEPDYLNLKLAPSTKIGVPRLADAPFDGVQDLEGDRRQRRPIAGDGRRHLLPHSRRIMGPRRDARAYGALPPDRAHVRGPLLPDGRSRGVSARARREDGGQDVGWVERSDTHQYRS